MARVNVTLPEFVRLLGGMPAAIAAAEKRGLEKAAAGVERDAKARLGIYQGEEGPFMGWSPLAQSTRQERREQGYPENEPLLREGILRDSITHDVGEQHGRLEAVVGVKHGMVQHEYEAEPQDIGAIAIDLERGTDRIPPRSFIGAAGYSEALRVVAAVKEAVSDTLASVPVRNF